MVCLPLEFFIKVKMKWCNSRPQLVFQTGHTSPNPFCSSGSSIASIPGLPRLFVLQFAFGISTQKRKSCCVGVLFWMQAKKQKWGGPGTSLGLQLGLHTLCPIGPIYTTRNDVYCYYLLWHCMCAHMRDGTDTMTPCTTCTMGVWDPCTGGFVKHYKWCSLPTGRLTSSPQLLLRWGANQPYCSRYV